MPNEDQWGPWIEHDGKGCPVPNGILAEITEVAIADGADFKKGDKRQGVVVVRPTLSWDWDLAITCIITRYRIRKPRGMTVLEAILREVENCPSCVS